MRLIAMHRDMHLDYLLDYIEGTDPKYPTITLWIHPQEIDCGGEPFFIYTPENRVPKHEPLT